MQPLTPAPQFGMILPGKRTAFANTQARFHQLSEETVQLGGKTRPFFHQQEQDRRIVRNLVTLGVMLARLKKFTLFEKLTPEVEAFQKAVTEGTDSMFNEHNRGYRTLAQVKDRLNRLPLGRAKDLLIEAIDSKTARENRTIRMYSGPKEGGGRICVF